MRIAVVLVVSLLLVGLVIGKNNVNYINSNKYVSPIVKHTISLGDIKNIQPTLKYSKTGKTSSNDYIKWDTDGGLIIRSQRDSNGVFFYEIPLPESKQFILKNYSNISVYVKFTVLDQKASSYASAIVIVMGNDSDSYSYDSGWGYKVPHSINIFYYNFDTRVKLIKLLGDVVYNNIVNVGEWFEKSYSKLYDGENIRTDMIGIYIGNGGYTTSPYSKIKITKFMIIVENMVKWGVFSKTLIL